MIVKVGGVIEDLHAILTPRGYSAGFSQMFTHPVINLVQQGFTSILCSGWVTRHLISKS